MAAPPARVLVPIHNYKFESISISNVAPFSAIIKWDDLTNVNVLQAFAVHKVPFADKIATEDLFQIIDSVKKMHEIVDCMQEYYYKYIV